MRRCRLGLKVIRYFYPAADMESYSLRPPHLTNGAAFGILSVFLLPGGNGSVCSASKTMEDAGRRYFYFCMEIINMAWVMLGIAGILRSFGRPV